MTRIEAVLFDLDGTLVDTWEMTSAAVVETLAEAGVTVTPAQLWANAGRPLRGWFSELGLPPDVSESAYWRYVDTITSRAALAKRLPGADSLLQALHARNCPTAIVTTRLTQIALPIIDAAGWTTLFHVVVGQETARRPKPAPDPALYALAALGAAPRLAALVGDTESDMICATEAEVSIRIGLEGERPASALHAAGATHVCKTLGEVEALLLTSFAT